MPAITITDLDNAALDAAHIAAIATSSALTATDRLGNVRPTLKAAIDTIKAFNSRGAWVTGTLYLVKDLVLVSGTWYVAVTQHTASAAFATDAANWRVYQGVVLSDLAAPGAADLFGFGPSTVGSELRSLAASAPKHQLSRPAYLEQHLSSFFGRGMLAAEAINIATEQAFVGSFAAGVTSLDMTSAAQIVIGGCVTIKHDNGKYGTYFVSNKATNNITIRPALRFACQTATARIERTWINRAHPGKFYMRELAQRIANSTELEAAAPNGNRVLFTNVSSNPNTPEDTLVALGGAAINYYAGSNLGDTGTVASPVRFALERAAFIDNITAIGSGAETPLFDVRDVGSAAVKVAFYALGGSTQYSIVVLDELGTERGKYIIPAGADQGLTRMYSLFADLRGAKQIKVRVACEVFTALGSVFALSHIDVFEAPQAAGKIIANPRASIVVLGDSWVAGDLGNTAEREPITTQLALEMPLATIRNAGVGGNTLANMLARFDADVTPYAPQYVVVNTGTNEAYNPFSGTFNPNAIDAFIAAYRVLLNKIAAIGARPIIIGVPALAQSDADVPAFAEWLLNDRSRSYAKAVFSSAARIPLIARDTTPVTNANGVAIKFADGTMICRHTVAVSTTAALTLAQATWTFPVAFVGLPKVEATLANYATAQLISVGLGSAATATAVSIAVVSGTGAFPAQVDCIAVGRWFA